MLFNNVDFSKFHYSGENKIDLNPDNYKNWKKPNLEDFKFDEDGNEIFFRKCYSFKPAECNLYLSEEHKYEILRCKISLPYFFLNYCRIKNSRSGKFEYPDKRSYQLRYLNHLQKYNKTCCIMPRVSGKKLCTIVYLLHKTLFENNINALYTTFSSANAIECMKYDLNIIISSLPKWMYPGISKFNNYNISFENNSSITVKSCNSKDISNINPDIIIGDEIGCMNEDGFMNILNKSKIIKESHLITTPRVIISNSGTHSKIIMKLYFDNNEYESFGMHQENNDRKMTWDEVPRYKTNSSIEFFCNEFKKYMIGNMGETAWKQEYECDYNSTLSSSLKWYFRTV